MKNDTSGYEQPAFQLFEKNNCNKRNENVVLCCVAHESAIKEIFYSKCFITNCAHIRRSVIMTLVVVKTQFMNIRKIEITILASVAHHADVNLK